MDWQLTEKEKATLMHDQLPQYETAVRYMAHDWFYGPWGGWGRAHEILKSLGWREEGRKEGDRTFVKLVKPDLEKCPFFCADCHSKEADCGYCVPCGYRWLEYNISNEYKDLGKREELGTKPSPTY